MKIRFPKKTGFSAEVRSSMKAQSQMKSRFSVKTPLVMNTRSPQNFRLFLAVALISFIGSLPVGTLNASVSGYVIAGDPAAAVWFGCGAILVEVGLVRAALAALSNIPDWKKHSTSIIPWLRLLACAVIFILAFINLAAAWHRQSTVAGVPLTGSHLPFLSGLILSLLNPLHLPFWMGWTAVLKSRGLIRPAQSGNSVHSQSNIFVLAIAAGTALAFTVYAAVGQLLIPYLKTHGYLFNAAVGIALLVAGLRLAMTVKAKASTKNPASAGIQENPANCYGCRQGSQ